MGFWELTGAIALGMVSGMVSTDWIRIGLSKLLTRQEARKAAEAQKRLALSLGIKEEQLRDYLRAISIFMSESSSEIPFFPIGFTSTSSDMPISGSGEKKKEQEIANDDTGQYL